MLDRLLTLVRQGGVQTPEGLARQMGVTPGLVQAMLADLQRRGYLQAASACGDSCTGCDSVEACAGASGQRAWRM